MPLICNVIVLFQQRVIASEGCWFFQYSVKNKIILSLLAYKREYTWNTMCELTHWSRHMTSPDHNELYIREGWDCISESNRPKSTHPFGCQHNAFFVTPFFWWLKDVLVTLRWRHMGAMASQITSLAIVYSTVYSDPDQRKHQSSASLAFVRGIHRGPVNSPHKWPVTRKMFPFHDVIMIK